MEFSSKLLPSGKYQVRFVVGDFYGYLLAEPKEPVREIIGRIIRHVEEASRQDVNSYYQRNLFSLGLRQPSSGRFLLFRKPDGNGERVTKGSKPMLKSIMNHLIMDEKSKAA